ncbi:DNA cytosine methyltransferase [Spirochaeta africana]|uniref:Cytosine-specific methyltransferase n=1 Tax=Spirochaeta africana (strain ATCC 700263 / DSM 8902 / Z-7692) TaxID=889378 RepID=H9UHH3_SPIAZ|nr:DNA (cytosine-5-)-methyltransferase [Spirochaeta africana]AFG36966.1 DNA-methyltransferase Dcm [Spirochaeta africana DSM 8902]
MDKIVYKLGELFCGPGGIARGAELASLETDSAEFSIKHVWATDYHKDTCATYRANFFKNSEDRVIQEDIRKLDFQILKDLSEIDGLAFGFPCNDFSLVGEQKGTDGEYGPLYTYGSKALVEFQPKWFLAENVGGLASSNEGKAFVSILDSFRSCGYNLFPHLYKFEQYGVPQARHRIIIIGIRHDLNIDFKIPAPTKEIKTAKQALENIPDWATNQELTKQSPRVVDRLSYIKPGENAFTADIPAHLQLNVKGAKISQIYKKIDPDKPSYTVTGSGGGGTHMYHWEENRALTNRERARLQTFPDYHVFEGSKESVRRQIGMAVPVDGVRLIFESLLKCFADVSYPFIQPSFDVLRYDDDPSEIEVVKQRLIQEVSGSVNELL